VNIVGETDLIGGAHFTWKAG